MFRKISASWTETYYTDSNLYTTQKQVIKRHFYTDLE